MPDQDAKSFGERDTEKMTALPLLTPVEARPPTPVDTERDKFLQTLASKVERTPSAIDLDAIEPDVISGRETLTD